MEMVMENPSGPWRLRPPSRLTLSQRASRICSPSGSNSLGKTRRGGAAPLQADAASFLPRRLRPRLPSPSRGSFNPRGPLREESGPPWWWRPLPAAEREASVEEKQADGPPVLERLCSPGLSCWKAAGMEKAKAPTGSPCEGGFRTLDSKSELAGHAPRERKVPNQLARPKRKWDGSDAGAFQSARCPLTGSANTARRSPKANREPQEKVPRPSGHGCALKSAVAGGWGPHGRSEESWQPGATAQEIESRQSGAVESTGVHHSEEERSSVRRQASGMGSSSLACREGTHGGVHFSRFGGVRPGLVSLLPRRSGHHPETNPGSVPEQRGIEGGPSGMLPRSLRPLWGAKTLSSPSGCPVEVSSASPAVGHLHPPRSLKSGPVSSWDPSLGSVVPDAPVSPLGSRPAWEPSASPALPSLKVLASAPGAAVEVHEGPGSGTGEPSRALAVAAPSSLFKQVVRGLRKEQEQNRREELRRIPGAWFKLPPSGASEDQLDPRRPKDTLEVERKGRPLEASVGEEGTHQVPEELSKPTLELLESSDKEEKGPYKGAGRCTPLAGPPGQGDTDANEIGPVPEQAKTSTLNPNATEFCSSKTLPSVSKPPRTPPFPGPCAPSTPTVSGITPGPRDTHSWQCVSSIPQTHAPPAVWATQRCPCPVSNSVPGQEPFVMESLVGAGPCLSNVFYGPWWFRAQPPMMPLEAHRPSQPVFAPLLQSPPPVDILAWTPTYPLAEQPTPQMVCTMGHPYACAGHCGASFVNYQKHPRVWPKEQATSQKGNVYVGQGLKSQCGVVDRAVQKDPRQPGF
ncbi:ataxin-2-like protein [Heteronotia binoei]|uniref:ataxin-2-like protein n=1 Tax=Heteronotia binoei TaxID=13085 RepID=UPI0029305ACC|nr:ataxin-2-like protein [Heteronotia binoei]